MHWTDDRHPSSLRARRSLPRSAEAVVYRLRTEVLMAAVHESVGPKPAYLGAVDEKRTSVMWVAPSRSKSIFLFRAGSDSALRLARVFGVSVPVDVSSPSAVFARPSFLAHRWSNALPASCS